MYEVIWSKFYDCYIVRSIENFSTVNPEFLGSEDQCNAWVSKNTSNNKSNRKTPIWSAGYKPTKDDCKGLYNHRFETSGGLVIDCYLAFEEEERATYDHPGSAAAVELIWALVEGVDISEVIGDLAATIEEEALEDMAVQAEHDQYDRGQERYENRRDAE